MKQPAAILVLQYWYTILVIPVFYQYLPVSAILVQILVNTSYPVSSRIFQYLQTRRYWSLPKYEYCRYRKILGNNGNTSIADTGRFWKILVILCFTILVLPVLLDEEYWSFQYCVFYNTSITSIVCFTILVLPVLLNEEYWSFQYRVFYNTSITSIVG